MRNSRITVRLNSEEYNTIKDKATYFRVPMALYIRNAALDKYMKSPLSEQDQNMWRNLSGACNNLNQLTRLAHTNGLNSMALEIIKMLKEFESIISTIKK